jgi:D-sedoheptulose 7-phosphate isomerase|tara:strand:- start:887 stop:1462 length:576 start_codon:yes stop_codon:yes gene_type:complete
MSDNNILNSFDESIRVISDSKKLIDEIQSASDLIIKCFSNDNKIVIFGNGGSAADSQHFAAEFIGRFQLERKSLPAIALTTDSSILTALGNDYSFDDIFSRQCESLVKKNDIVIAISTSGNSLNVINGIISSKNNGAIIIGILGNNGGKIKNLVNLPIIIPSNSTPRIQESHRLILHIICDLVEKYTANKK